MNTLCPVCNGLHEINDRCPSCGNVTQDLGKVSDYWAPYSPYREIEDLKMTNGYIDAIAQRCIHKMYCDACQHSYVYSVAEIGSTKL